MSLADLRRRLEQHEASRHISAPTKIVANYPVENEEAANAIRNWRQWVQDGRASVRAGVIYLLHPMPTAEEWAVLYVTEIEYCQ